ncbi:hypothetical protein GGI07_004780, partial [Coemansia sp. Benny D115]
MVTPKQMRPTQRCDILCVLVIESTQHMQNLFHELYDSVITKVITQLRTPVIVESAGKKSQATKATPCVRLGVVFFGDYFPYSTRTCSTQYFTSNYREFTKTIKAHRFCEGGRLRCAATEGLVGALEMFDDFAEYDPEAHLTNIQQRHVVLVSSTPPYSEPCRENVHMRYDGFGLDDVAKRMRELKVSFSLIQERATRIDQVENLLKTANTSSKAPFELPRGMSPNFDVRLMGIDLPIPPEFSEAVAQPTPIAPAAPISIQPQPQPQMPQVQPQTQTQTQVHAQAPTPAHTQPQPQTQTQNQPQAQLQPSGQSIPGAGQQLASAEPPQQQQTLQTQIKTPPQLIPQKNKSDAVLQLDETSGVAKKPKIEADATAMGAAGSTVDEPAKAGRGKARAKSGGSARKGSRASNSPAVSAKPIPVTPQTDTSMANPGSVAQQQAQPLSAASNQSMFHAGDAAALSAQAMARANSQQLQQNGNALEPNAEMQANNGAQIPAAAYSVLLSELKSKGATPEELRLVLFWLTQLQNQSRPPHERLEFRKQLDIIVTRLRQNPATAGNAGSGPLQSAAQPEGASQPAMQMGAVNNVSIAQQQAQALP